MAEKKKAKLLSYKGKPLVRCGNVIYYGYANEPYVVHMQVMSTKKVNDLNVADKVRVALIKTDPGVKPADRIVKKSEKNGLYQAMDIGSVWLELALEDNK